MQRTRILLLSLELVTCPALACTQHTISQTPSKRSAEPRLVAPPTVPTARKPSRFDQNGPKTDQAPARTPNCMARSIEPTAVGAKLDISYPGATCPHENGAFALSLVAEYYAIPVNECDLMKAMIDDNVANALYDDLHISFFHVLGDIDETSLQREIASGRPVIIRYDTSESGDYAVVTEFTPADDSGHARYRLMSPVTFLGNSLRTYDELTVMWGDTWSHRLPPESFCRANPNGLKAAAP